MKHLLVGFIVIIIVTLIYHEYQIWYAEPMAQLEHDEKMLELEQGVVEAYRIKADTFEQNQSIEKATVWRTNENLHIKNVDTNYSDGNHSIRI